MLEAQQARQCVDRNAAMHPVKLMAETVTGGMQSIVGLYAAEHAKAHWLSRTFAVERRFPQTLIR
jgi:hypothetical protein